MIEVRVEESVRLFTVKVGEWKVGAVRCHGSQCAESWLFDDWAPQHVKARDHSQEMHMDPLHEATKTAHYLDTHDGIAKAVQAVMRAARFGRQRGDVVKKTGAAR